MSETATTTGVTVEWEVVLDDGSIDHDGEDVSVDWRFSRYDPGRTYGDPYDCYPPEGGEVLSCVVTRADGTIIEDGWSWLVEQLGEREADEYAQIALDRSLDERDAKLEDYYDWRREVRREEGR